MSKKISEFFKKTAKDQNSLNCGKIAEIKVENLPEIRDCQVIIKDIKNQFQKEPKMFDEVSLKDLKNSESKVVKKGGKMCKFCEKEFSDPSGLKYHLKHFHGNELNVLSCSLCSMKFFKKEVLDTHMKKKHPNGQTEHFECDFDGKIFKIKGILRHHMKDHQPEVECHICHKMLKFRSLDSHLKITHATDQIIQCQICLKMFKTASILHRHEKTHNKKFQCEICKSMQPSQGRLNRHIKFYHENTETYKCEDCNKEFRRKDHFKRHQKTHDRNRPKPFKCHRCDYATDRQDHFNNHQKVHENQDKKFEAMKNPIKCEKCPKFCKNKETLKNHMSFVHPKVQFQCDLCAKFIKAKRNLKSHMKVHISRIF